MFWPDGQNSSAPTFQLQHNNSKTMNAINVIAPYKHLGMRVFDDPRVGLDKEPFVAGADAMMDRIERPFLMLRGALF
jgi:hypothetical protein